MLRADNVICGTSTTGTGTLTLAATPGPPGGIDFDVFARATGVGFGNSAAILVSYTIIEYTDSTFATAKSHEKGVGTLTLGSSSGIANCTLARTTKQSSATSLNSQPATQNIAPATGISIGTAANTLVFIGASAADVLAFPPYIDTADGLSTTYGAGPMGATANTFQPALIHLQDVYNAFIWAVPMLVKRITIDVAAAYTGGTTDFYARIYAISSTGRPGKLLYDFGALGTAGSALASTGRIQSGASGSGFYLIPGEYYMNFLASFSGGSGTPGVRTYQYGLNSGRTSMNPNIANFMPTCIFHASSGTAGAAPDPANLTSYAVDGTNQHLLFGLSPT